LDAAEEAAWATPAKAFATPAACAAAVGAVVVVVVAELASGAAGAPGGVGRGGGGAYAGRSIGRGGGRHRGARVRGRGGRGRMLRLYRPGRRRGGMAGVCRGRVAAAHTARARRDSAGAHSAPIDCRRLRGLFGGRRLRGLVGGRRRGLFRHRRLLGLLGRGGGRCRAGSGQRRCAGVGGGCGRGGEARGEPGRKDLVLEEGKRLVLLIGAGLVVGEVDDLDLDRAILTELLEGRVDPGGHPVRLGADANAEAVIDTLEVGGDLDIQGWPHAGELKVVNRANRRHAALKRGLQDAGAVFAQRQRKQGVIFAKQFRRHGAENVLYRLERASGCGVAGPSAALEIERHDLHAAFVERHWGEPRILGCGKRGPYLADQIVPCVVGEFQAHGHVQKANALYSGGGDVGRVLDQQELRFVAAWQRG
jgi:hypothetical protein